MNMQKYHLKKQSHQELPFAENKIAVNQLDWSQLIDFGDLPNFYHGLWQRNTNHQTC